MKKEWKELVGQWLKYISGFIKPKKPNGNRLSYRGVSYNESDLIARQQGNNNMSYRGVSYKLSNSEIKVKI